METIVLRGNSKSNAKLLLELAKKLHFSAKSLSSLEEEEMGLAISIGEGMNSEILSKDEKDSFLDTL